MYPVVVFAKAALLRRNTYDKTQQTNKVKKPVRYFRPLPNDQTLLVKHFKFALQQMFDRLVTSKNIACSTFLSNVVIANAQAWTPCCLEISLGAEMLQAVLKITKDMTCNFGQAAKRSNIAWQAKVSRICGVMFLKKDQKHFLLDASKTCSTSSIFGRGQTVKHFAWQANLKCLTNKVWSFG